MPRRCLGLLMLAVGCATTGLGWGDTAQQGAPQRLDVYISPAAAARCPPARELQARLAALEEARSARRPMAVSIALGADDQGAFVLAIRFDLDGTIGRRMLMDPSCGALADAAIELVRLALHLRADARHAASTPTSPPPVISTSMRSSQPPPSRSAGIAVAAGQWLEAAQGAPFKNEPHGAWQLGILPYAEQRVAPRWNLRATLAFHQLVLRRGAAATYDVQARVWLIGGAACWRWRDAAKLVWGSCGGLQGGLYERRAYAIDPSWRRSAWLGFTGGPFVKKAITRRDWIALEGTLGVPLTRERGDQAEGTQVDLSLRIKPVSGAIAVGYERIFF